MTAHRLLTIQPRNPSATGRDAVGPWDIVETFPSGGRLIVESHEGILDAADRVEALGGGANLDRLREDCQPGCIGCASLRAAVVEGRL